MSAQALSLCGIQPHRSSRSLSFSGRFSAPPPLTAGALAASPLSSACDVVLPLASSALETARVRANAAARALGLPFSRASATRVCGYYLPVFHWILRQREAWCGVHGREECEPPTGQAESETEAGSATGAGGRGLRSESGSTSGSGAGGSHGVKAHALRSPSSGALFVLGISAPQGCGKTTLVTALTAMARASGLRAAGLSLDDVYLTGAEQDALSARGNPLLASRGNAGTHDVPLLLSTLRALARASPERPALVPRYDKAARDGRGDRAPRDAWERVEAVPDLVLLEGWMLGFRGKGKQDKEAQGGDGGEQTKEGEHAVGREETEGERSVGVGDHGMGKGRAEGCGTDIASPSFSAALEEIDGLLLERYDAIWSREIASWLVVQVCDPSISKTWRLEAEHAQKARGQPGMTDAQVERFMECYIPVYRAYLPELYAKGPPGRGPVLTVQVDDSRNPLGATAKKTQHIEQPNGTPKDRSSR